MPSSGVIVIPLHRNWLGFGRVIVIVKNMQLRVSITIIEMCLIVIDTLFNEITIMYHAVSQNATYHSQKY